MDDGEQAPRVSLSALTPAEVSRVLSRAGGAAVDEAMVRRALAEGAPTNADGTINIITLIAWATREVATEGGSGHRSAPPEAE